MTVNKELISIIVPVYNVDKYLSKCVESIINQTYHNLEIILVDDGSSDRSLEICEAYAKMDERIRVIHQDNSGVSSARNAGIDIATGDYIGFVDSDDYIEPTMFEGLYKGIQTHACDIAICNHYVVEKGKLLLEMPTIDQERVYKAREAIKLLLEDKVIKNYPCDKLFKADLFRGIRFPVGRNYEDMAIMYKLFDKAQKVCQLQKFGYYYVRRENSISDNNNINKWFKNCNDIAIGACEKYEYFSSKKDVELKELSLAIMFKHIKEYLVLGYKLKCYNNFEYYKQLLRKLKKEIDQNQYISLKDKIIAHYLSYSNWICFLGVQADGLIKIPYFKKD